MKTIKEITDVFSLMPLGSLVRIILLRGYSLRYDEKSKTIAIAGAEKFEMGMPREDLTARLKEYSAFGGSGNATLELETSGGYSFSINCSQIHDYEVFEKAKS